MTKADLVKIISENTGIIRKDVAVVVDAFLQAIKDSLIKGNHIEIRGFGTYKLKTRKPRVGRNPKTDEKVPVPERTVPTFKFSREFKNSVLDVKTK
ncbi:MAG TPA: HU family DNA-binding protein [Candidatus Cloacimonas sp.]|jgi:nucleoid DNA-binding protein|nr:integration host factor subunit beta [Candidatus Cloacimonas sp.]MDD2250813.1 integration host factor subunit beta [Candidatus Cloacimonadota bacterium]MCK9157529.1 integration host factor subunit beta [Candidatus Cloacimonas sp.]MCK9164431.1 integration host factor subunit beta [Candidatus Cloacimonas sp.]MDD3733838.1 integration host factor subunit beta [Candidatus Cloacimonadota bacterium]